MTRRSSEPLYQSLAYGEDTGALTIQSETHLNKPCDDVLTNSYELEKLAPERLQISIRRQWYDGWRGGTLLSSLAVLASLIINVTVAAWLSRNATFENGLAELYRGDCSKARNMNILVHIAINILSTMMLSGSNYTMQVLVAPTRRETEKAHQQGKWLDIGVPSIRNLFLIAPTRMILWLVLALSSLPLHLMFNSAFYASFATNDYNVLIVNPTFLQGASFRVPNTTIDIPALQSRANTDAFERLENSDCIDAYATELLDHRRNLLIVSSESVNDSSILTGITYSFSASLTGSNGSFGWLCDEPQVQAYIDWQKALHPNYQYLGCSHYMADLKKNASMWAPLGSKAEYCLSERVAGRCSFNANQKIILTIISVNIIKAVVMLYVALCLQNDGMMVVGDAVQSFLTQPDSTTSNMCLLTQSEMVRFTQTANDQHLSRIQKLQDRATGGRNIHPKQKLWYCASSRWRQLTTWLVLLYYPTLILAFFMLARWGMAVSDWSSIKAAGFGRMNVESTLHGNGWLPNRIQDPAGQVIANTLLANTPQVFLSLIYLVANSHLTAMFAADEWSDFALHRKNLRVSAPRGLQRSTYFLQLPYKVAIPLMIITTTLHWLVSQSIFLVVVSEWSAEDVLLNKMALGTCGISLLPMVVGLVISIVTSLLIAAIGFRKYNPYIPLVGSCSFAIAASCHAPAWEEDSALLPLKWGAVTVGGWGPYTTTNEDGKQVGHCCFSSGEVETPVVGRLYAGLHLKDE